jgi:hypothetical protein
VCLGAVDFAVLKGEVWCATVDCALQISAILSA